MQHNCLTAPRVGVDEHLIKTNLKGAITKPCNSCGVSLYLDPTDLTVGVKTVLCLACTKELADLSGGVMTIEEGLKRGLLRNVN